MSLRNVLLGSLLLVPALAACGDDSGGAGGSGGEGATTGASATATGTGSGTTTTGSASTTSASSGATTGATTGATSSSSTGGEGGGGTTLSCDTSCATVMDACETDLQYPNEASCLAACAAFPDGVYQDADASLGCHQYHADAAIADPVIHCGHAGPMGDGQCGADPCENFCEIAPVICPEVYTSPDVCAKVCAGFTVGEFSVSPPATGDTLGCRMYHLTVAAQSAGDAVTHCEHTAAVSTQCN